MRGIALDWFRNYVLDIKQYVLYDKTTSLVKYIPCGAPQGSVFRTTVIYHMIYRIS